MSWAAGNFAPTPKRGVGTAFMVSIYNVMAIGSNQFYFDPEDDFRKGHAIAAGCLFLVFLASFTIRTILKVSNSRKAKFINEMDEKARAEYLDEEIAEMKDSDPRYKYIL